jgi:signal transduction histidine kinase
MRASGAKVLCIAFCLASGAPGGSQASRPSEILYIASSNSIERTYLMHQAFLSAWQQREPDVSLFTLQINAFSFPLSDKDFESTRSMLAGRLAAKPPSLIVAHGDSSLKLALPLRDAHFPGTPIIAYEIPTSTRTRYAENRSLYIINLENFGIPNIRLALRLFPRSRSVILLTQVGADAKPYLSYLEDLRRLFPGIRIEAVLNPDHATADATLRAATRDSVVVNFSPGWVGADGRFLSGKKLIGFLTETYGLPVFEFLQEDAGTGLVGGVGISASAWGRAAAELGLSILLDGKEADYWTSSEKLAVAFVDHRALTRFGSSIALAPEGAVILNRPPSIWVSYRLAFQAGIVVLLMFVCALAVSLQYRRRERRILLGKNLELEREVAARTNELRGYNEELKASNDNLVKAIRKTEDMQESVLRSAREITLDRLTAGIANEVNSPLNAVRSANAAIRSVQLERGGGFSSQLLDLDDRQRSLFRRYAPRGIAGAARSMDAPPGTVSDLERRLESCSCAEPASVAADLAEAGLHDLSGAEISEFAGGEARAVAHALYLLGILGRSIRYVDSAVDQAAAAIEAVREYLSGYGDDKPAGTVNLRSTIERAISLFGNRMKSTVSVQTDFRDTRPLRGSEAIFIRLWVHLIQNALQAMEGGGELRISLMEEEACAVVIVEDEGGGIPPAIGDRIFEPFFTTRARAEGMGLGLAYCKRILDTVHGTISHSNKARGAVFTIRIPYGDGP